MHIVSGLACPIRRLPSRALLAPALCCAMLSSPGSLQAAAFTEFVDPNPAAGNQFGASVVALSTGNVVITSPFDDAGGVDAGAVYLFNGSSGALITTLRGSTANDLAGSGGVTALSNGNYVVVSPSWDNGAIADAGAVTWGSGTTGVGGAVSAANSLVGSTAGDFVGGFVRALSNGNYVVAGPNWDKGAIAGAGAATWGSGTAGVTGTVSAANSLVGSTAGDLVGTGVTALTNGHYVVLSPSWDNGAIADAGAVTWGSGTIGVVGAVSAANSLVGSTALDQIGGGGATALTNGNYVVLNPSWDNGAIADAGAVTWGSGTFVVTGAVSAVNSLVGSTAGDLVGTGVTALTNGHYVVLNPSWDNGAIADDGAATWGSGTVGVTGAVSAANSLVGSTAGDKVASSGVTPLSNGNYVVRSLNWDNGVNSNAGAVTWGSGTAGVTGAVSSLNSLVGSTSGAQIGSGGVIALSNGNYVVGSPFVNSGAFTDVGAATWGSGTSGVTGGLSAANSLIGSAASDRVGSSVTALSNGNYVVLSTNWDNGAVVNAGAATWGSGMTGVSGTVSAANSLVGSTASDQLGSGGVTALSNGNYVVRSPNWDNGALVNAGAAAWGSGMIGVSGAVSTANSLIGASANTNLQLTVEDSVNKSFFAKFAAEGGGRVRVGPPGSPEIVSAIDIPSDQGGWLRLTFNRSIRDDGDAAPPVGTYGVWRLVPGTVAFNAGRGYPDAAVGSRPDLLTTERLRALLSTNLDAREVDGRLYVTGSPAAKIAFTFPPGTWELVTSVPAVQQTQYVVAVATISNAAANDYVVTAHTNTPSIWFRSNTASGQSVDNLAPAEPTGLTAAYSSGETNLQWAANTEHDLDSYRLYRGTSADFTPSPGNQIASPTATSYADVGPAGSYYKLSAVDVNGNESSFALITPEQTAGVGGGEPVAFALEGVRPNPASGSGLNVAFALPTPGFARLELLDVGGRRVLMREVDSMDAGRHRVNLAEGRSVAPGVYWVRLTQGTNQQTTRVAVID